MAVSPTLLAATAAPDACRQAGPDTGDCIGWSDYQTNDPLFAAIRSEIALGRGKQAQHFYDKVQSRLSAADRPVATQALSMLAGGGDARAASALMTPVTSPAVPAVEAQQTHGQTLATSYYSWVLHGSTTVNVYYGECSSYTESCTTGGWWVFNTSINTFFTSDGINFYEHVSHGGGSSARIIDHEVRILQDISGHPDSVKSKYGCFTSTTGNDECSAYSRPSMATSDWYYVQIDFVDQPTGYPNSSFQIQTRRWKIISSTNWQILAYGTGG